MKKILFLIIILYTIPFFSIFADERTEPKDIIVALDKSLSMEEEIDEVKNYVNNYIVEQLIIDDYFLLITFYKTTKVTVAKKITSESDKEEIKKEVSKIMANGSFTDIGLVLDRLEDELNERMENNRIKRFFLITDGVHEPTKGSPYWSPNGTFKHKFQDELIDAFRKKGWKMQILAIGIESDVSAIAAELKAQYIKTDNDVTAEEINELVGDPIGSLVIQEDSIKPLIIRSGGKGTLEFTVRSERFSKAPQVIIQAISLELANFTEFNILEKDFETYFPEEGDTTLKIPVIIKEKPEPGDYKTNLSFSYASVEKMNDALPIELHINSVFENNPFLLPLIILGVLAATALLVILVFFILKSFGVGPASGIQFRVDIDEAPLPEKLNKFKLSGKKQLFLCESMDKVSILTKRNSKAIALLTAGKDQLKLKVLNEFRFEDKDNIPPNVLGESILINTLSNKTYHIKFTKLS